MMWQKVMLGGRTDFVEMIMATPDPAKAQYHCCEKLILKEPLIP